MARTKTGSGAPQKAAGKTGDDRALHIPPILPRANHIPAKPPLGVVRGSGAKDLRTISTARARTAAALAAKAGARRGMPSRATAPKSGGVKKPPRYRPGIVALREIRRYQGNTKEGTGHLIRRLPFARLCREIAQDLKPGVRFKASALIALQDITEAYAGKSLKRTRN